MTSVQDTQQASGEQILSQFHNALTRFESADSFYCGGSLPVLPITKYENFTSGNTRVTCPRPVIFWRKENVAKHATFDRNWNTIRHWASSLDELIQDCCPAKFGYGDQNVFDEKVRKAGALGADSISTKFHPYDFGIVDTVARELLPGLVTAGKQLPVERWGIVAELYQLNPYSAPSGMFKPHVDTPRGRTHFGSLVVVLPTEIKGNILTQTLTIRRARAPNLLPGGQLKIIHKGRNESISNMTNGITLKVLLDGLSSTAIANTKFYLSLQDTVSR
ncbi:hypothetical protein EDB81DRAFT_887600 [Dactylonectria macrodidyma]|uniref:Fe2OG dioxygenase domain-containing protein n=1 Tax=Dactylonectria macrodidyma TaxID=307937 RepID=A0A9P9IWQ3_9HYPO|nr:hypothetical protein EDB81DRAFT_887600 [Dactylonectria macrodidyma]